MKAVAIVGIISVLVFASFANNFLTSDVPLCLWSSQNNFVGQNLAVSESMNVGDVGSILHELLSGSPLRYPLTKYTVSNSEKPEIIVLFLEPKLRTDTLSTFASSFSNLKDLLLSAKSSISIPFINYISNLDDTVIVAAQQASSNGANVLYAGRGSSLLQDLIGVEAISINALEKTLKEKSELFSNGKIDLLIVHLDQTADTQKEKFDNTNSIISKTINVVEKLTDKYIAGYTGLSYDSIEKDNLYHQYAAKRAIFEALQVPIPNDTIINESNITNNTNFFWEYFGGWFWEVLLLVIITIPILITGIYAIEGIQAPDRFPKLKGY